MESVPQFSTDQPAPLFLSVQQPTERDRLTAALRLIWAIPQIIVLIFVSLAAFVVVIFGWFGALFTGRLPAFASEFLRGVVRWITRFDAYLYFLTDEYPPFSLDEHPEYPVQVAIPPDAQLNPLSVLFRIILVVPAAVVSGVVGAGIGCLAIASWAMITFTGTMPVPLFEATRVVTRYQMRLYGYFWMLTAEYPWGVMGDSTAPAQSNATQQGAWTIILSDGGRNAMIVTIVLGIVFSILNNNRL